MLKRYICETCVRSAKIPRRVYFDLNAQRKANESTSTNAPSTSTNIASNTDEIPISENEPLSSIANTSTSAIEPSTSLTESNTAVNNEASTNEATDNNEIANLNETTPSTSGVATLISDSNQTISNALERHIECISSNSTANDTLANPIPSSTSSQTTEEELPEGEYFVEAVCAHRWTRGVREFRVKWRGYCDLQSTWEPEKSLTNCANLVHDYLQRFPSQTPSKLPRTVGASSYGTHEKRNWVDLNKVITTINRYRNSTFGSGILAEKLDKLRSKPTIYILDDFNHCFVILHKAPSNIGYIADGNNNFLNDKEVRDQIERKVKLNLIGVKYNGQYLDDECASSGIMIALRFMQSNRTETILTSIEEVSSLKTKLRNSFHKYKSQTINTYNIADNKVKQCSICNKKFKFNKQQNKKLKAHERLCQKSSIAPF